MRILLLEDDEVLAQMLVRSLTQQNYVVDAVGDGEAGWEYAQTGNYELILMDVGLPLLDGISLCQRLRSNGCSTPILLMTAKNAIADRIRGLDAGADDYLSKPLDLGELQARVRALLRRGEVIPTAVLSVGDLSLDPNRARVSYGDRELKLTPKEYNLLELFLRNPTRVYSRSQIVDHLWNFDDPPLEESVKAHVKGLRQKLRKVGAADWIENIYGLGYRLNPQAGQASESGTVGNIQEQYDNAVEKMWRQYQDVMVERMTALQAAASAAKSGKIDNAVQKSAEKAAHKLAGVLGMFGRETGTNLAREIEELLVQEDNQIGQKLPVLVQELAEILSLSPGNGLMNGEEARLLLINIDLQLGQGLQELAGGQGMAWFQAENIQQAQTWLQSHAPELVILGVDTNVTSPELTLIENLAARTPKIPAIAIAEADILENRVKIARVGGCGYFDSSATAGQIWDLSQQLLERDRQLATKVLVVDDDPMFLAALRPLLAPWGIKLTDLSDPRDFWQVLESVQPDLLILDVDMPEISGIELCQAVRTDQKWQGLPILFLTSHNDGETIAQVFAAGADDYATKPVVGAELLTRITNRLERNRLLKSISSKDSQTGLYNYAASRSFLDSLLKQAQQQQIGFCLAILQVIELEQINFKFGHDIGIQVLQKWGNLIKKVFRNGEVLGYWGYGEFIIGMSGIKGNQGRERMNEIMAVLRQQIFTTSNGQRFSVACNCLVAEYPEDAQSIHALYQKMKNLE